MSAIWVVVADASRARIFSVSTPTGALEEIESIVHPASRLQNREIDSDRGGRSFDSSGPGRHSKTRENDAHAVAAQSFARDLATTLERARHAGRFERLCVAAAPEFLGLLRTAFGATLKRAVAHEIAHDYTHVPLHELRAYLPERL